MNRLLAHLLLFLALFGLAGQGAASAMPTCPSMATAMTAVSTVTASDASTMAAMPDCKGCPDKGMSKPAKSPAPCKDMYPACLAMTGCAAIAAVDPFVPAMDHPLVMEGLLRPLPQRLLVGRSIPPDIRPPNILA